MHAAPSSERYNARNYGVSPGARKRRFDPIRHDRKTLSAQRGGGDKLRDQRQNVPGRHRQLAKQVVVEFHRVRVALGIGRIVE